MEIITTIMLLSKEKECKNLKVRVENREASQVKLFMRRNRLNIERCNADTIQLWI